LNLTIDFEDYKFSQREIHVEKLKRNLKRKSRKQEEEREIKSLLKENMKQKLM
jgi:hypothetical protein